MNDFTSLTEALDGHFDKKIAELPDAKRRRIQRDFYPMPWDDLTPDQRRSVAAQWDYWHDPVTKLDREFWWNFFIRKNRIKEEITKWETISAPTANDLEKQQTKLTELRQKLAAMEEKESNARNDYLESRFRRPDKSLTSDNLDYIAYPIALKLLSDRLNATPEEIAAWVWIGPNDGGLAAYLNANELAPPPRFYFDYYMGDDYLSPLMACWFLADDIDKFQPDDRYITSKSLIERWGEQPGIKVDAFIQAKIAESRLLDIHPTMGVTQWSEEKDFPDKALALFALSHVEAIEKDDFGTKPNLRNSGNDSSPEIGSLEWRRQNAKAAADARHNRPGGSRDKQELIRAIWATGKYSSRDRCAEEECASLGMSYKAARNALINTPAPKTPPHC